MLSKFNRYLAVAFVDAESVKPNKQQCDRFVNEFSSLNLLSVAIQQGKFGNIDSRIGFIAPDGTWQVLVLNNQFHVARLAVDPEGEDLGSLAEFTTTACKILNWLITEFKRTPHRLGLVREGILDQKDASEINILANRILNLPDLFKGKNLNEWDWRASATIDQEFGGLQEETNAIITIKRVNLEIVQEAISPGVASLAAFASLPIKKPILRVDLDVNTRQDNTSARFEVEKVEAFFQNVNGWQRELEDEAAKLIERGN